MTGSTPVGWGLNLAAHDRLKSLEYAKYVREHVFNVDGRRGIHYKSAWM